MALSTPIKPAFFLDQDSFPGIPIFLVDASGSVRGNYEGHVTIFDRMAKYARDGGFAQYRILFWNGDEVPDAFFVKGIYAIPFVVKAATLQQTFTAVASKITNECLTFPHLAFEQLLTLHQWIDLTQRTQVFFVTDGQIGFGSIPSHRLAELKRRLSTAIKALVTKYPTIELTIVTIEAVNRDFTQVEALKAAAGSDVYNVIMEHNLTSFVRKFVSITPNHPTGFVQLDRATVLPGFVPFLGDSFSQANLPEFLQYLRELIAASNEDELLKIVQGLATTVSVLIKDKPTTVANGIISTFCNMFGGTTLDPLLVDWILVQAIRNEQVGKAQVFAEYRARLKELYKMANDILKSDVPKAIGLMMSSTFLTLPVGDKVFRGPIRLADQTVRGFPRGGVSVNGIIVPIMPSSFPATSTLMTKQCLRQWIRQVIAVQYKVDVLADVVIYIVLGLVIRVVLSDVPAEVKMTYRRLGEIMLEKKRLNSDQTELDKVIGGDLPIPNDGDFRKFHAFMATVNGQLGTSLRPLTLWYAMCAALAIPQLADRQLIHCAADIKADGYADGYDPMHFLDQLRPSITQIQCVQIPAELGYEYHCLITLDDVSSVGGFGFKPHGDCSPPYVISVDGYAQLTAIPAQTLCPICYRRLTTTDFEKIGPKPTASTLQVFPPGTPNVFGSGYVTSPLKASAPAFGPTPAPSSTSSLSAAPTPASLSTSSLSAAPAPASSSSSPPQKRVVLFLRGTVGCGKTTATDRLKALLEARGYHVVVASSDHYCSLGHSPQGAAAQVQRDITVLMRSTHPRIVLIVDTCGTQVNLKKVFDVDLTGWTSRTYWPNWNQANLDNYLHWTLRNVLRRGPVGTNTGFYLTPASAGVATCVSVHQKKVQQLQLIKNKQVGNSLEFNKLSITSLADLPKLDAKADAYQSYLDTELPLDAEVQKVADSIDL